LLFLIFCAAPRLLAPLHSIWRCARGVFLGASHGPTAQILVGRPPPLGGRVALDTDSCSLSLSLSLFSSSCESLRCAWGLGRGWDRKGVSPNQLEATRARFVLFHTASYWPGRAPQAHRDPRNVAVSATRTKLNYLCFVPVDSGTESSRNTATHKQRCSVTCFRTLSYCFVLLRTRPDARRRLTGTHET